jgi:hypothetical protein
MDISILIKNINNLYYDYTINKYKRIMEMKMKEKKGGINKYIKTDKKITIIYNKKQYTRVIYICNNKKYIKINKTFMLLSKLKKI